MTQVMAGIRILEVAEHTFVPAASAVLAEWGADVIKVEHVERGDAMRGLASTGVIDLGKGAVHALLEHSNRGKRSIGLDLSSPDGLGILFKLVEGSDVFLTNKMPGVRSRLGIEVEDVRAHNPSIVYVRGSGYGPLGPDADKGGYDQLAFWCRSGNAMGAMAPEAVEVPMQPAPAYGDSIGAMTIAGGICAALLHRERTGESSVVDVSLLSTGMWAIGAAIALSLQVGQPYRQPQPEQRGMIRNPLAQTYRTKDDRWISLTCLQGFHYWPEARRAFGLDHLADDERFATVEAFADNAPAARGLLAEVVATDTLANWVQRLHDFRGQWSAVQDSLEVVDDPQTVANGYIQETTNAAGVPFRLVSSPVQFDQAPSPVKRAPEFNEHGDAILTDELGMSWDDVVDLKVKGVVA